MFDCVYPYRLATKTKGGNGHSVIHLFRFRTRQNRVILFQAECFDNHPIAVVKFYDKAHRESKNRFTLLTETGGFSAVVWTCLHIMFVDMVHENPYMSFAFMGAPKPTETDLDQTHRYRLYSEVMKRRFSPVDYEHLVMDSCSCYFMFCRNYCEHNPAAIDEMLDTLKKVYPDEAGW